MMKSNLHSEVLCNTWLRGDVPFALWNEVNTQSNVYTMISLFEWATILIKFVVLWAPPT